MDFDVADFLTRVRKGTRAALRRVTPYAAAYVTSTKRLESHRAAVEKKRQKSGAAHVISYFHDVTDPYSYLVSQKLGALMHTYDVELRPMLVSPPRDEAAPERAMLMAYSLKDAMDIAPHYGLNFRTGRSMPSPEAFADAGRLLSASIARSSFDKDAPEIGAALWTNDQATLDAIKAKLPMADEKLYARHLKQGDKERDRQGHYLGGVFAYGDECYWGLDRLHHLESRLLSLGLRNSFAAPKLIAPRRHEADQTSMIKAPNVTLDFFFSLRSPYSYIAMERTFKLAEHHGINLVLRPVLPMVMRGLEVPRTKRMYITKDTKREAELDAISFGKVCDPVGEPVERAFSLYPWAEEQGLAKEFFLSFAKGVFADGLDGGTDRGLRKIVERAGLDWTEAEARLGQEGWREPLEENRALMFELGLWGVPSYRVSNPEFEDDFVTWGQDRLWLVEEEIKKRR